MGQIGKMMDGRRLAGLVQQGFVEAGTGLRAPTSPGGTAWRVEVADSFEALERHRAAWDALLDALPDDRGLFFRLPWMRAMAPTYLGGRRRMHVLLAWCGDRLAGVAPMTVETRAWWRGGIRRAAFWGTVAGSSRMEGDFLVPDRQDVGPCMRAFAEALRDPRTGADWLDLQYFRDASHCREAFVTEAGLTPLHEEAMHTHWACLPASFEAYTATLKRAMLSKAQNRVRAARRDLGAWLECVDRLSPEDLAQVEALHVQRQTDLSSRGRERESLFLSPAERASYLERLERAAQDGSARHYLLKGADGRVLAFSLCFHAGRTLFFHLTAFDGALARYELGRVLMLLKIEAEIARGDTDRIDMLPGTTRVKEDFGNVVSGYRRYQGLRPGSWATRARWAAVCAERGVLALPAQVAGLGARLAQLRLALAPASSEGSSNPASSMLRSNSSTSVGA